MSGKYENPEYMAWHISACERRTVWLLDGQCGEIMSVHYRTGSAKVRVYTERSSFHALVLVSSIALVWIDDAWVSLPLWQLPDPGRRTEYPTMQSRSWLRVHPSTEMLRRVAAIQGSDSTSPSPACAAESAAER